MMEIFIQLLDSTDSKTVTIVLEALKNLLHCGAEFFPIKGNNSFLEMFESFGGTGKVEKLQKH
jgi:hypothetical protein